MTNNNNFIDEIKFLKVKPGEAIEIIDALIKNGFMALDKIRADYSQNKENPGARQDQWMSWFQEWAREVMNKLNEIYISPNRANYFRDRVGRNLSFSGDTALTNWELSFETKMDILRGYYDFIMSTGRPTLMVNGDLVFQQGENINYEKK